MKNLFKFATIVAFALSCTATFAQKSGRINVQEVVVSMPEMAAMQTNLEAFQKDLSETLETMQVELNNKFADYQKNVSTYTTSVRGLKEKEMNDLQTRMQQFEQNAVQEVQAKQNELLEPILTKARAAIAEVAKAGGYTVVYDTSLGQLAYFDEVAVEDIAPAVKKKLAVK